MLKVRRALISVSDKRDLISFAKGLDNLGIEILSTGGTCQKLHEANISAIEVSKKTGFPEIMDGRVKTLHPIIHGGLLGRRGIDELVMDKHNIEPIDLLVVNLYPFEKVIKKNTTTTEEAIENIDIGGPAMIRAASKNHSDVIVVVDPDDYDKVLLSLNNNQISKKYRIKLARKAFSHTASYDMEIAKYLNKKFSSNLFDNKMFYSGDLISNLRYGENPHQKAAFYSDHEIPNGSLASSKKIQGKELSYNNIADSDAAINCVKQFKQPACVIVKHANPCGVAVNNTILESYKRAYSTDPTSAFGGVIAFNTSLDEKTARTIVEKQFVEVIIAPKIEKKAKTILSKKENIRVIETGLFNKDLKENYDFKKVSGGLLVQTIDQGTINELNLQVVTKRKPSESETKDLMFAWKVVKYVKSNAIIFCKNEMTIGIGAGQMSRVYSTKIAAIKASDEGLPIQDSVMASDAFFPFRDGIDAAAEHNISSIIQPGGSMRDDEVIEAANEHNLAMVFTNMRHFRH
mgnify:FL=1